MHWSEDAPVDFRSTLQILATDRDGLTMDVTLVIANLRVPMHEIYARGLKNGNAEITLTISTQGLEHLQTIIQRLSKIRGVISVERSGK